MAIRTLPSQEIYSNKNSRGGGTQPMKKLKKLRSVKVANLDRLRLSMRREKTWFNPGSPSESSSSAMSGTSSPNYMKATTSSSARKASSSSSRTPERRNSPASRGKSSSKLSNVSVEQCSDPTGVSVPVEIRSGQNLKRVPSMKRSKKLSSKKSMKIRAKYSQFPDESIDELGRLRFQIPEFAENVDPYYDQDAMIAMEPKPKGLLERSLSRSRSIRLMRLKSMRKIRTSRRPKSRFGGRTTVQGTSEAEKSNAEPHYMKVTRSLEARKYSAKGLTRTSTLRPLRILAKIPSLRPRSKVRKRPEITPSPGISVDRATCSSVLKSSKFPDHIPLNSGGIESEGISSSHLCPYNYCSLHGHHHHHTPSPPLKEFITAKRQSVNNQKGKQLETQSREAVIHSKSVTETNQWEQTVDAESPVVKEVINATTVNNPEVEDSGMDFLIKVYAKPRKKWAIEGSPREDAELFNGLDRTKFTYYEWKLEDTLGDTSRPKAREEALNEGKLGLSMWNIALGDKTQQQTTKIAVPDLSVKSPDNVTKSSSVDEGLETYTEEEETRSSLKNPSNSSSINSEASAGSDLINILTDKRKYSSIWHLIYQQSISSEKSMAGNQGVKSLVEDEDTRDAATEKADFNQTAAVKLVQEALAAILQHDGPSDQQAVPDPDQELPCSPEGISIPAVSSEENFREKGVEVTEKPSLESEDKMHGVEQEGEALKQRAESDEEKMPGKKISKSLSKLRKLIVTAKFIKAMEKLRKISPGKPRHLPSEPTPEEERIYLRHLSMNERKYEEEWMLDFALRKAISRLDPDEQRRVALLVEAFETFTPDNKEMSTKYYPVKGDTAPGNKLSTPKNEETNQPVESKQDMSTSDEQVHQKQDDEVSPYHEGIPEERSFRQDCEYETSATVDKILQEADETGILLVSSGNNTTSIDRGFEEPVRGNEENLRTLQAPFRIPIEDSEVNPADEMSNVLFDSQKYTSMWNMIYQHVTSSETSMEGNQDINRFHEKDKSGDPNTCQETNDLDSTHSSCSTDHEEDEDNQSASRGKHELNQSAAIKLVKEAVEAILQRYELSSDLQATTDQNNATHDIREFCISTPIYSTEESSRGGNKRVITPSEPEVLEKTSDASLQQVKANGSKAPPKKMSKSLSRLRKAIVTTKFIKAMERLRKINPQKPQHLLPEAASEEERVSLRHLSMDEKKNSEEWMLDYALRRVISKLAPDQQRKVARLVEAFETVTPEQKEKGTRYYPLKDKPAASIRLAPKNKEQEQLVNSEVEISVFNEKVPQQDDGLSHSCEANPEQSLLLEDNDGQSSRADDKTQQHTDKTAASKSTLERSKNCSKSAQVDVAVEDLSTGNAETTTSNVPSISAKGDSEIDTAGDMTAILSDEQKYTSMWRLIYQHVIPSEASTSREQRFNEVDEDEQDEDANNGDETNDPYSTESMTIESRNKMEDENKQSAACEEQELDQSAAVKLVREAINAILKCHEQRYNEQSLQEHHIAAESGEDLCNKADATSTKENSIRWKGVEKHRISESEDKIHTVVNENAPLQMKVEASKMKTSERSSTKSFSKLRKVFITAKFMKAMERMRRITPRQPRYLSPEAASEEEKVNLRHQGINERRRNAEEWMLDYALRKVISNMAPEQQRRVALLVEAFETVTPEKKGSGIRGYMKAEGVPAVDVGSTANGKQIIESQHDNHTPYDDHIGPNTGDKSNLLDKTAQLNRSPGEEHPTEISNVKTKLHEEVLRSNDSNLHYQTSSKGCPVGELLNILTERKEIRSNSKCETLQVASLSKDTKQDHEANVTEGNFSEMHKHTSMWHLIYQHARSVTAVEAGSNLSERGASEDQLKNGSASSDADADDSDASSVTSELTESEAVQLVREAINDILSAPQELDNELLSSNIAASFDENQKAGGGEQREKTLSRGYSKLRKLIICNKFIKAMAKSKMQKSHPTKRQNQMLNSDQEGQKVNLKPSLVGEKKGTDELMLDHALQKVIAGLAPVQQRRVALLVKAFEEVNLDTEETGKRFSSSGTEYPSSAGNAKEKKDSIFKSSQNSSQLPVGFNHKLQESVTTSSRELASDSALEEMHKENTPIMSRIDWRNSCPSRIIAARSIGEGTLSTDCKDSTEVNPGDVPGWHDHHEKVTSVDISNSEPVVEIAETPQAEDLEDEGNHSAENDVSLDKVRRTSLWRLLVQHVKPNITEETETQLPGAADTNARVHRGQALQELEDIDQYQPSSELNSDEDMNIHMPKSKSFELQEKEAIKVVQEALDAILTCDDQFMTTSTTSDKDGVTENHEHQGEPSPAAEEIEGVGTLVDSVAQPKEERAFAEEKLSNTYSQVSKVILCKRFIKAIDKMRKLKPQSPRDHSQQLQSEETIVHPMRQTVSNQRKNWEEWMLDHAMQQVVGTLAPAQKKKVSLLVQAFERVSSQPEPSTGKKGKAEGL